MPYLHYEQVTVGAGIGSIVDLQPPDNAHGVEIQADTQNVRYTMDGTNPNATTGMLFLTTAEPKYFIIDDLKNIKFARVASGAVLNFHYIAGRDV